MSREFARLYIHLDSAGEQAECVPVYRDIRQKAKELFDKKNIIGYRLAIIQDDEHAEGKQLPFLLDYNSITAGKFPFVYSEIQPAREVTYDLDAMMKVMNFTHCG